VILRAYRNEDLERIKQLHAKQGFGFPFPDLTDPVFAVGCIAEEDGEAQMAAFLKVHAEAYLFLDPAHGTPRERWQALLQIHEAVRRQALELGLDGVTAWLPPSLPKAFTRRLKKLGWGKDEWESYSFRVR